MRGIRLSLELGEAFRRQLEGIVRANERGNLRVTFPFISSVDEVREARRILAGVRVPSAPPAGRVPIGVMLEIPSTLFIVDALADLVDFFTLGTNDLVQYTLASNRDGFYDPGPFASAHPACARGWRSSAGRPPPATARWSAAGRWPRTPTSC